MTNAINNTGKGELNINEPKEIAALKAAIQLISPVFNRGI